MHRIQKIDLVKLPNLPIIHYKDKDGNRYYDNTETCIVSCIPNYANQNQRFLKAGSGCSAELAYCTMSKSENIPKRLRYNHLEISLKSLK